MSDTLLLTNTNDTAFESIFPEKIQKLSKIHWTPIPVVRKAASFLAQAPGAKILDIGSGIGKFCIAGAQLFPDSEFHGIEQRKNLVDYAKMAKKVNGTENVHFAHGNFTQLDFQNYDSFYFYNSFGENLIDIAHIDESVEHSSSLYIYYSNYLYNELNYRPKGTRLVTFHGFDHQIPYCYHLEESHNQGVLRMWIKK